MTFSLVSCLLIILTTWKSIKEKFFNQPELNFNFRFYFLTKIFFFCRFYFLLMTYRGFFLERIRLIQQIKKRQ